jgi:hypothetical protein
MADLDNLPVTELNTEQQLPLVDVGPEWIDAATVARFAELVENGILFFEFDPTDLMREAGDTLDALFALHLSEPSSNRFAVDHRAFALNKAVKELVARRAPAKAAPQLQVPRAIGNLEMYLQEKRVEYSYLSPIDSDLLFDAAFLLDPKRVEWLTGVSIGQLAAWRSAGSGPRFLKVAGERSSVRYPAAALLEWLGAL